MTARTFGIGLSLSIIVGIPIGILMGISSRADKILSVWVNPFSLSSNYCSNPSTNAHTRHC